MSAVDTGAPAALRAAIRAARRRALVATLAGWLPVLVAAVLVAAAFAGRAAAIAAAAVVIALAAFALRARIARLTARHFARRLDTDPAFEDSADLLFAAGAALGPLQRLQRERLEALLAASPARDLRPAWPVRGIALAWFAAALALAALYWPSAAQTPAETVAATPGSDAPTVTLLVAAELTVAPPPYTGMPTTASDGLSTTTPAGSTLRWRLHLSPQPEAVALALHDGSTLPLQFDGEAWTGELPLERPTLYRIAVDGALPYEDTTLHRLQPIPDRPPRVRVLAPDRNLSLRAEGQRGWTLEFAAEDDHGLGDARLRLTMTKGSGEQVAVSERTLPIRGEGDGRQRRYATTLDLATLGMAEGDDLIVRLEVADRRHDAAGRPAPQRSRSASVILRWPPPAGDESVGMEGLVRRALPAYFRSQRQIIIDTEALLAERPRLPAERFSQRADAIGVDQRILRMRYGEFLGEENDGGRDVGGADAHADDDGHGADGGDGFGAAGDVVAAYGHTHDDAEAATLLDPETRAILKQALDAMWQSERELRSGDPRDALPHQYRALDFIKRVQQASRIYLARVGLELPPIDPARRMTGDRAGIGSRRDGLRAADVAPSPALDLWQAAATLPVPVAVLDDFAVWIDVHPDAVAEPVDLLAALAMLRAEPDCTRCAEDLRMRLWPLLPRAVPAPTARPAADAAGGAWLDALARGAAAADDTATEDGE
ncbi:DUF4175 family protein [Arenimonas composti]|uniref:DUF4175 domain-containing protein n=1 Tax=Arenimonas composti TR7-09 = DSM 18010 TaxID=1121013 RepID=A0A091BF46_9GAMM|nr:DUF4175 family protein [Arenimonas composti]KFN49424.1 hypothetical protein P873_10650 [Arenimonas composti TR7-09 = DSM 18010]